MNPEKQRTLIAEACGWEFAPGYPQQMAQNKRLGLRWGYINDRGYVPDYLSDLNAMHEAEKVCIIGKILPYGEWATHVFQKNLKLIIGEDMWIGHATAAQRAEAFLRTLCKWEN